MNFKLNVDKLLNLSLEKVKKEVDDNYKRPLKELKLFDVLIDETTNKAMRHGVYLFFNDKNECLYVGMCSVGHFIQRLGSHFGMSRNCGMNTFLRGVVKKRYPKNTDKGRSQEDQLKDYVDTIKNIGDYSYLMIGANKDRIFIQELEKIFQKLMITKKKQLDMQCTLKKQLDMQCTRKKQLEDKK